MENLQQIANLLRYLAEIVASGDWLNPWLVELPKLIRPEVQEVGHWLAGLMGY